MGKDRIISVRFSQKCITLLKKISSRRGIKPAKLVQIITDDYIKILNPCFARRDMIIQRAEYMELYQNIPLDKLDEWVEKSFKKTLSCMKIFVPVLEFHKMTDAWMKFYEMNSHHLVYEDNDGWRTFRCITDMGYNWCHVYGNVYCNIFQYKSFEVKDFIVQEDEFSFKVKIPDDDSEK